jgi:Xaa-Pro aminopeptidase
VEGSFFTSNRNALAEKLNGGLVILSGYDRLQRSLDDSHPFIQESNLFYLSGISEPNVKLVIDGASHRSYLILAGVDETHRIFDGTITNEEALKRSGVDKILTEDEADVFIRRLAKHHSLVYMVDQPTYAKSFTFSLNPALTRHRKYLERIFDRVQDCRKELAELRSIKRPEEVHAIEKAVAITSKAFQTVRTRLPELKHEYEVEALFSYEMRKLGAEGHAYDPIVASGRHACTLHYSHNGGKLGTKELLLMDVGARFQGYAADITRTFAVKNPSKRHAQVHDAVETAHHKIVALLEPHLSVNEYQNRVDLIMVEALKQCDLYENEASLRRYFPHAISHGLGIDVHDSLAQPRNFLEGMVLTVEPGIYIPEEGIGVRIEDDIVITSSGHRNLSKTLSTGL